MRTVVAVFAHPDDETFICGGTLAKLAAAGCRVVLVCATRGEMGRRMGVPPTATRESIGEVRERELRAACEALGIARLSLLGLRDKTLEIQPPGRLREMVLRELALEQPEVVITFHERLGGHPDHCAIGLAATEAFAAYRETQPQARLYFVAWSHMVDQAETWGLRREQFVAVDVAGHLQAKLRAFRAHRTQSGLHADLWQSEKQALRRLGRTEYFIQAYPPFMREADGLL
ncbi:bacillithiol biosynthesis deacetylase BshB2 [Alicyclobacillus cellulosilyticus]|uniref:Bacillithiol biosynthesis deacetylase BshB2 n=1 Tax=Alicyclobacillus cellulosilyticus TaxID=1003997 RepID=A0A917K872_9BACL|nr:bacillithiol biosynthesis deacetylase BshB2 [Alicyclobacillus cellulosilyticus]